MRIPTIRVKKPTEFGGFRIINESDFDPKVHELFDELKAAKEIEELESRPEGVSHTISANGSWTVYDGDTVVKKGRGKAKLAAFLKTLA